MRRPASRSTMRVAGGPAATARRPSVCHPSASAGDVRRHGSAGATRTTPRVLSGIIPAASAATSATRRPAVQHDLAFEAELPDEGRHEASVEVCAWPVPIRSTGVARNRPREVDGNHRPELSQVRNEVDPHARAAGHRGHQQVNRCVGSRSRSGLRADIVHGHAAHARRHAAQPRPLLRPDAPVVVSHGEPFRLSWWCSQATRYSQATRRPSSDVMEVHQRQGRHRGLGTGTRPSRPLRTRHKIIRSDLHPNSSREEKNR